MAPPKYWAVREGHNPGVYSDWDSAKAQTDKCSNNQHKSFKDYQAAKDFVEGPPPTMGKPYYGVQSGYNPGVYDRWGPSGAQEQVQGYPGAATRGFNDYSAAHDYAHGGGNSSSQYSSGAKSSADPSYGGGHGQSSGSKNSADSYYGQSGYGDH